MESNGGLLRVVSLTLVAVAIWFLGHVFEGLPTPRGADAPATEFSAARAYATLGRLLGHQVPHPVSSAANQAIRDRVRTEFDHLGVMTLIDRRTGCNGRPAYGYFFCGTTEDIVAQVSPGEGKAIILLAHYDSVPAGPGASDDQSGVATILETVRALKARGMQTRHPIFAVITDGEEAGLLGAAAFAGDPQFKDRVGVVVNVEARGNQGPSLLFQTSAGDSRLIDLYAKYVPEYATSSLFAVIYRLLPNDTDLTIFLNKGLTGFNFAFSGNVAHYHTPLDRRENLSQATLQMHGDNALGVVSGLMQTDFDSLKGGDAVYLTLLGKALPRMPAWALPLAIAAFLALAATVWFSRGDTPGIGRRAVAFAVPLLVLIGGAAFGWVLHEIASLVSGQPDPGYAYPVALRIALALGVLAVTLLVSRLTTVRLSALSVWLWTAVLALVTAFFLPGLSPYFLFPAIVAAVLLPLQARLPGAWSGALGQFVIFLAALLPLLIWFSLSSAAESIQGLALHPLITVTLGFGALVLLPLFAARPLSRGAWQWTTAAVAVAALLVAVVAGLQPAYSTYSPQRLNIAFVDDHVANKSEWAIETGAPVPASFRSAAPFSAQPVQVTPLVFQKMYVAPAGATRFDPPSADAVIVPHGAGRIVTMRVHASDRANRVVIVVPKNAGLTGVELRSNSFTPRPDALLPAGTIIGCVTDDCRSMTVKLTFATRAKTTFTLGEQTYSLPSDGVKLVEARPATTIPSQSGDTTIVFGKLTL